MTAFTSADVDGDRVPDSITAAGTGGGPAYDFSGNQTHLPVEERFS